MARARPGWLDRPDAPAYGSGPASLVRSVRRHPLLVAVVALAALAAAALWLASRSEPYEATAEILVTPAPDDGGPDRSLPLLRTSGDRTRIVQTAASLIDSAGAAQGTARALGDGWTAERVDGAVTVEPVGQTDVIAVTAQADTAALSARLANAFAQAALDARAQELRPRIEALQTQLQGELSAQDDPASQVAVDISERLSELRAVQAAGDPTLSLTRRAQAPAGPVGTSPWLLLAVAIVAGLAVGVGAAMLADLIGPQAIADAAQAGALVGAPVLAQVPLPAREPARPPPAVVRAARKLEVQLAGDAPPARTLLVVSPTAGDEAAACVAGFAVALARAGRDVLVADLDPARAVADKLDATPWTEGALTMLEARAVPTAAERKPYDCVLVHAPAIIESGEALRVARAVDAVVLVIRSRRTTTDDLDLALRLLERAGARPDAVVLVTGRTLPRLARSAPQRDEAAASVAESPRELDLRRAR